MFSSPTTRLETMARLSACMDASDVSAPIELRADLGVSHVTSSPTSGSIAPNLASTLLFGMLSCASAQIAEAACSRASDVPSRTMVHSGAMAPVRATAV